MIAFLLGVLALLIGLGFSIALHEIGHLVPAKKFGVKVTQYMIGFGPTLFSRTRGETEYGIKAIPLGGYIRMIGMFPPRHGKVQADSTGFFQQMANDAKEYDSSLYDATEVHRTFSALSVPKKLVVMLGGPFMNLLISAFLMLVLVCGIGLPKLTTEIASVSECVVPADAPADVSCDGKPAAPAAAAGILPGDVVRSINGTPTRSWNDLTTQVRAAGGRTISIDVERDGHMLTVEATPIVDTRPKIDSNGLVVRDDNGDFETEEVGFLGVEGTPALVRGSPLEVPGLVWNAFWGTVKVVATLPIRLVDVVTAAFGPDERDPDGPIGVVGVTRLAGEIASAEQPGFNLAERAGSMISILASLNMALFVFNLVPLVPLDGGHVAGALVEGARRWWARLRGEPDPGPFDMSRLLPITNAVAVLLIGMTLLLVYADIVSPVRLFN